jgi:hypothetical protein
MTTESDSAVKGRPLAGFAAGLILASSLAGTAVVLTGQPRCWPTTAKGACCSLTSHVG